MALVIDLRITEGLHTRSLGLVEIKRMEPLDDRENPYDEVHEYRVRRVNKHEETHVTHRYGDGAWTLATKALESLRIEDRMPRPEA